MRFAEIGQQLRAYRLESGLRAEEIAARLGVSRAALYRYEKGEVIKLDTVNRLAELLKISPLSLLGIGVEYYSRPLGYLERVRQLEETTDQILQVAGSLCYLTTTEAYDSTAAEILRELGDDGPEGRAARHAAEQVLALFAARKRAYQARRPGIIAILSVAGVERLLRRGIFPCAEMPERARRHCRDLAATEIENIARIMESEPMGLQFGLIGGDEPGGAFELLRSRERAVLAVNPFRSDALPSSQAGVAMITGADEAVATHQRAAEGFWRDALKGAAAAKRLRMLVNEAAGREARPPALHAV